MARARNLKPGFFQNEILAEVAPLGRLLFAGLWTIADRSGRLEDRPKRIKVSLLPYDDTDVDTLLDELAKRGFITRYEAAGGKFIQVQNFAKHQNPHCREPESTIPAPGEHSASTVPASDEHGTGPAPSLLLIPDSLNPHPPSLGSEEDTSAVAADPDETGGTETALQVACKATWAAYSLAYFDRYGTEPVRNAKVNTNVKQFVQRLGAGEAPLVAAWFVSHPKAYYVGKSHDFGALLADAEALRTEWATGRVMTQSRARQSDRAGGTMAALDQVLAEIGGDK